MSVAERIPLAEKIAGTIDVIDSLTERLQKAKNGDPRENALADRLTNLLTGIKNSTFGDFPAVVLYRLSPQTQETPEIAEPQVVIPPDLDQTASPVVLPEVLEGEQPRQKIPEVLATPEVTGVLHVLEPPELQEEIGAEKLRVLDLAAIAKVKAGDSEAYGEIYERYVDRVYRHIYYRTGSNEIAEDLTSQVFLNALRAIGRYKNTQRPLVVWLLSIAHNLLVDHYRGKHETKNVEDIVILDKDRTHDPVDFSEREFDNKVLKQALGQLKGDQRAVVVMRYINEMEYRDIATILNKSEGAIRVILHRALLSLRGIMELEEGKITKVPTEERFSYRALAEILGMNDRTLAKEVVIAEKRGQLELSTRSGRRDRFTREDVAAVLTYLGKDPSLALTIPYR